MQITDTTKNPIELQTIELEKFQDATLNIIADLDRQKKEIEQVQDATLNIMADLDREKLELKEAQLSLEEQKKDLEKANIELNDFAYVVSHDLKAPFRGIASISEWLYSDYHDKFDENGKEQLKLLINRTKRVHELIEGILHYSRIGRVKEEKLNVDLNELIKIIIDRISPPPHIKIKVEKKLPTIFCEKTGMEQVFQNLLSNAVKFIDKPEGIIKINCDSDNDPYKFCIEDNGKGIEEKYYNKVFQIFQTLQARDEFESTGIGLTIVKKVIEGFKGKVWIESVLGKGSKFFFTLPK